MGEIIVLEEKLRNQSVQNKIRRNILIKVIYYLVCVPYPMAGPISSRGYWKSS
jgi:hypothetical protein